MGLRRYTASADNTIANAFEANLVTRGTGSNMGYADSLAVFSIYGQTSGSTEGQTQELSRILIDFPVTTMAADRTAGTIPASGSVSFFLRMYNAETPFTLPQDFNLVVAPISRSWVEGSGLDMDEYKDLGKSNWISASTTTAWTNIGADYRTGSNYNISFPLGYENIELDITDLVENWLSSTDPAYVNNYGIGLRLTASQEAYFSSSTGVDTSVSIQNTGGATTSYYLKKFFSRSTEFFFKRPLLEARWDSRVLDNRENFYYSSSRAPAADNLNKLNMYNYIRGQLVNIPSVGTDDILVSFYSSSARVPTGSKLLLPVGGGVVAGDDLNATGTFLSTGIYTCNTALTAASTPVAAIHDVWHSGGVEFYTGSFYPELMPTYASAPTFNKITTITNLKKQYSRKETARFRMFIRDRNWSPTVYNIATTNNPTDIITSASYSIHRVTDDLRVVAYGTGSNYTTFLSYDDKGNYFDFDVSVLEAGYMYQIRLVYYNGSVASWEEQPQTFKFRVEE